MGRGRRNREPVEVRLDRLEARHTSGLDAEGRRWKVRAAPAGATVKAQPGRKQTARRLGIVEPAPDAVEPRCPVFGTCGGCQLQEMPLARQREEKGRLVERLVGPLDGVEATPITGGVGAYGYRNKLELSWGPRRYVPEGQQIPDEGGSHLGFHPPGWFSKIVDIAGCPLGTPGMNQVIGAVAAMKLAPAWDNRTHTGTWRHLVVRQGASVMTTLVTSSSASLDEVGRVAEELEDSVLWVVTDSKADVATGDLRAVLQGAAELEVDLGPVTMRLPHDAFFQVNTAGAQLLFDIVGRMAGEGGTLVDLYCGVGAIGLYLAERFDRVVGIEIHEQAVRCARDNAAANSITGEWHAGPVEDVLPSLGLEEDASLVVDPPRAGLHPRAARFLAGCGARSLVYVACNPASLGRDREILEEGGWRLRELASVDLFPQTHHVEAVGRFER